MIKKFFKKKRKSDSFVKKLLNHELLSESVKEIIKQDMECNT